MPDAPDTAEFAIVVGDPLQGRGLGSLLARELATAARSAGIRRFSATMAGENVAVRRLIAHFTRTLERDARRRRRARGGRRTGGVARLPVRLARGAYAGGARTLRSPLPEPGRTGAGGVVCGPVGARVAVHVRLAPDRAAARLPRRALGRRAGAVGRAPAPGRPRARADGGDAHLPARDRVRPRVPPDRGRRLGQVGVGARHDRARRRRAPVAHRGRDGRHHRAQARRGPRPALPRRRRHDPARPAHRPDRRAAQPPRPRAAGLRGRRADRQGLVRRGRPRGRPPGPPRQLRARARGDGEPFTYHQGDVVTRSGERRTIAWRNTLLRDPSGRGRRHPRLGRGHHRAPARGGGDLPPRLLRPADRAAQPHPARGRAAPLRQPLRALGPRGRAAARRPRQLQARQRLLRPRRRRPAAAPDRRPPARDRGRRGCSRGSAATSS